MWIRTQAKRGLRGGVGLAALAALAVFAQSVPAYAQAQTYTLDIPAQDLGSALRALARATRQQITFESKSVRGKRSPALKGTYSARGALDALLAGSGLVVTTGRSGLLIVRPAATWDAASSPQTSASMGEDESSRESQDIVVTGSRIRGQKTASPTITIDREYIAETGATTVQDVMRTVPENFTGGSNEFAAIAAVNTNGSVSNLAYGSGINLRGLGTNSTLTLLNGRRIAPGGAGEFVDVSALPLSAIERIDIVPDGASAIYGSDAVGGVVNFVLRKDFRGAETSLNYGMVTEGGLRRYAASQLFGAGNDQRSMLLVLDYNKAEPLLSTERPFATDISRIVSTNLSADQERYSLLTSFNFELTPGLRFNGMGFANWREARVRNILSVGPQILDSLGKTNDAGVLGELEWELDGNWQLTGAYSYAQSTTERLVQYSATTTLPRSEIDTVYDQQVGSVTIDLEGSLFRLPGGAARLAIGGEYREEDLAVARAAVNRTTTATPPVRGRSVKAGYAELFVPLIGSANAGAFGKRLEVTGAVRAEDYSDVGSTTNVKFGLAWEPVRGMTLRGTYGTSFRAPLLNDYDGTLGSATTYAIPRPGNTPVLTLLLSGIPADDLGPEKARTWSAGFDVDPDAAAGFGIKFTYFDIDYRDRIVKPATGSLATFLTDPLVAPFLSSPPDPRLLELALLMPTQNFFVPLASVTTTFDGRLQNQDRTRLRGIDLDISKRFDLAGGTLLASAHGSYLIEFSNQSVAAVPAVDIVDTIFRPVDLKVRGKLGWANRNFSIAGFVNYVDSYTDNRVATAPVKIPSWVTYDLSIGYSFDAGPVRGLTLRFTGNNIFNAYPPYLTGSGTGTLGSPGYDAQNADPIGRLLSFAATKKW